MVAAARGLSLALAAVDSLAVILRALLESIVAAALGLSLAFAVAALLAEALLALLEAMIVAALGSGLALVVVGLLVVVASLASLHHLRRLACRLFLLNKRVILVMVS